MAVKLNTVDNHSEGFTILAQLNIRNDRISHLELNFFHLTAQIWEYITRCVNIKTLKIGLECGGSFTKCNEPDRMNLEQLDSLTRLEILMPVLLAPAKFYLKNTLEVIEPFMKQVKSLNTLAVGFTYFDNDPYYLAFDSIRSSIDLSTWSLIQTRNSRKLTFILTKIVK